MRVLNACSKRTCCRCGRTILKTSAWTNRPRGGNQRSAGRFRYNNKVWKVNFDTHYEPLLLAYEAIKNDPFCQSFEEEMTPKGSALVLIDKLRRKMETDKFKYMYIYEENG